MNIVPISEMDNEILSYEVNEIHQACNNLGHTTNWESFNKELKTYSFEDKVRLLNELKGLEIKEITCIACLSIIEEKEYYMDNNENYLHKQCYEEFDKKVI